MILDKIKDFFLRYTEEDRMNDVLIDNIICMFEKNKENITRKFNSGNTEYRGIDPKFYLDVYYVYGKASGYIKGVSGIWITSLDSGCNYTKLHKSRSHKKLADVLIEFEKNYKENEETSMLYSETQLKQYILKKECK